MFDEATLNRLYRYCCSLCDQPSDAYDLLQAGVERCLRSPPAQSQSSRAYAMRIIRNLHIDQLRRGKIVEFETFDEASHPVDYDIASLEDIVMDAAQLDAVWPKLKSAEREILFLWAVEGYSTDEVAGLLDRSRNTILSIIHRLRRRLRTAEQSPEAAG